MDSLANYGSDDDYGEDAPEEARPRDDKTPPAATDGYSSPGDRRKQQQKDEGKHHQQHGKERRSSFSRQHQQADVNYEEVGMELSEESDRSSEEKQSSSSSRNSRQREDHHHHGRSRHEKERDRENRDRDDHRSRRHESERHRKDKHHDRDKRRRERQRSRSPRRSDHRRRSRSRERERAENKYSKRYDRASNKMAHLDKLGIEIKTPDCQYVTPSELKRSMDDEQQNRRNNFDNSGATNFQQKLQHQLQQLQQAQPQLQQQQQQQQQQEQLQNNSNAGGDKGRFFMPGITGRFRDQIEKRKLLWQKNKEPEKEAKGGPPVQARAEPNSGESGGTSKTGKLWETTTFAQDTDGKVANKFKRLMGIKNSTDGAKSNELVKKQEEMFSSMEQQYEVARTATHTMRGVGLGFGSYQR